MANVGDRYKTGDVCVTTGTYSFDGYADGRPRAAPTAEERVISLSRAERFPPIRSTNAAAWWRLATVR